MIRPTKNLTHDSVNEKLTNENITYLPMESDNFEYLYQGVTNCYLPIKRRKKEINGRWKKEGGHLLPY
ncbi:hypothetical protein SAMN04488122_0583 [Chitinophaga arvensicola]|uniref:Uncharacterized protein n=1 Tax=Chitinophaga arvensicola TaxID=29529 RepID=A0A1I0P6Z2_9BACT|nr:hypothetical protein SAMN04488122_0583 [Chitinophaga arvensicola]